MVFTLRPGERSSGKLRQRCVPTSADLKPPPPGTSRLVLSMVIARSIGLHLCMVNH